MDVKDNEEKLKVDLQQDEESRPTASKSKFTPRLAFAICAAALGSAFQHGYNTGVVNAPQDLIQQWISNVSENRTGESPNPRYVTMIWSAAVSIYCVGGMIGGALTSMFAQRFGIRGGLLLNNVFVFIAAALQGFSMMAKSYELIIFGRLLIGINSGLNAGLAPMYLAEISPVSYRGAVGTVYQLVVTISILFAQIMGMETVLGTTTSWPLLFAIVVAPAVMQILVLPLCPESPKYLLSKERDSEALNALKWLRGANDVDQEMNEMREKDGSGSGSSISLRELLVSPSLRAPLIIAMMVMICQQLSGINAVMFFSTEIFQTAHLSKLNAQYATLSMGTVNVLMTVVSLVLVERAGRKTLLLVGLSGMAVVTAVLAIALHYSATVLWVSYASIALVLLFVILFATGPGSIPWFLVSELFNQQARPSATAFAVTVNWAANFIVGLGFLPLQEVLKGWVFLIFSGLLASFVWFVYKKVPETKNKTSEEIAATFRHKSYEA